MKNSQEATDEGSMSFSNTLSILHGLCKIGIASLGLAGLLWGFRFIAGTDLIVPQQAEYQSDQSRLYFIQAIESLTKDLDRYPNHVETYMLRGSAYCQLQMYDACLRDYDTALRLSPQQIQLYRFRGRAYASIGKTTHALEDFSRWITVHPKNPTGYFERAEVYLMVRDWKEAEADLDAAIEFGGTLEVQNSLRQIVRALELEHKKQDQQALQIYQQLKNRSGMYKSYPLVLLRMADLLTRLEQEDEALLLLNELLDLNPSNQRVKLMWESLVYPNGIPSIDIQNFPFTT